MEKSKLSIKRFCGPALVVLLFAVFYISTFTSAPAAYTLSGNSVYIENTGKGIILQNPHTLNDFSNFPVINFTSLYAQNMNFDVMLGVSSNSVKVVSAEVWENYTHETMNRNCTERWLNTSSQNGTWDNHTFDYCQPYISSEAYFDWKPYGIELSQYAGKNYFAVPGIPVAPQETKTIRPRIEISPKVGGNSGKYEILVKPSDSTLSQALGTGDNVLLDPWWNQTWRSCRNLNITDVTGRNWTNTIQVTLTGLYYSNAYELRTVNATCDNDDGIAQNYKILSNGTEWVEVRLNVSNYRTTNNDNFTVWSVYYDPDKAVENPNYAYVNSENATFDWPRDYFDVYNYSLYSGSSDYNGYPISGCASRDMRYSVGDTGYVGVTPQPFTPNTTTKYVVIGFNINCGSGGGNMSVWYNNELVGFLDRTSIKPWQRLGNPPLNDSRLEEFAVYRRWVCGAGNGNVACGAGAGDNQQRWFFYVPVTKYVNNASLKINNTGNWLGIVDDVRFTNATTEEFNSSPIFEVFWNTSMGGSFSQSANETDARAAIEQGINDTIPTSSRYPDQWIYTRNLTHQRLGRFDKVAVLGNQTWAFNFRSTGEPELNGMSGIGRTVNVWEKTNLKASEIRTLVGAFINSTKW